MKILKALCGNAFVLSFTLLGLCAVGHAEEDQLNDPDVQQTLRAMKDTSTWFHPDLFGEFTGMRYYAKHQYKEAMKYLEIGAYYADKLSQLSIGLMHMNGDGVQKDDATALAWFDIASERGYPDFVATRDKLRATMSNEELVKSAEIRRGLEPRYGDAAAKPRMAVQLRQGMMQFTGSRTGFDSGVAHLWGGGAKGAQVAIGGGTDMYAKERWDPDRYFKIRDAEWKATVTVGAVDIQSKVDERTNDNPAPAQQAHAIN